jgi:hypothetical protein
MGVTEAHSAAPTPQAEFGHASEAGGNLRLKLSRRGYAGQGSRTWLCRTRFSDAGSPSCRRCEPCLLIKQVCASIVTIDFCEFANNIHLSRVAGRCYNTQYRMLLDDGAHSDLKRSASTSTSAKIGQRKITVELEPGFAVGLIKRAKPLSWRAAA